MGRAQDRVAVGGEIAIALIVGHDIDDVGGPLGFPRVDRRRFLRQPVGWPHSGTAGLGERVAEFGTKLLRYLLQLGHHLRMGSGDLLPLTRIGHQIVERLFHFQRCICSRPSIGAGSLSGHRARGVWQKQLPAAATHPLQLVIEIPEAVGPLGARPGRWQPGEQGSDVVAVDRSSLHQAAAGGILRQGLASETCKRGKQIDRHRRLAADLPCGNDTAQPGQAGDPHAPLKYRSLPLAEIPGTAGMVAIGKPRAVVAGKNHQRVVGMAGAFQRRQHGAQ